jgi:hypothetical protein
VYHTLLWHRPNLNEVYPGRRNEPIGVCVSGGDLTRPVGAVDFLPKLTYEVASAEPRKDAERLLRSLLKAAYRRPVAEADVQRFLALHDDQFKKGHGFTRYLLSVDSVVLASPEFVFVEEKQGRLDEHTLATRLALFLAGRQGRTRQAGRAARSDRADARQPEVAPLR